MKTVKLGDICDVLGGKRIPKGEKLSETPTNHPYIRVVDFDGRGGVSTDHLKYVPDKIWNQIARYTISKDDVFLSIAGTIGVTGFVPNELDGANLTENACKLVLKINIDKKYLYYFTLSKSFRSQALAGIKQTAQPKLALTRIKDIRIPLPSLEEQRQVVARLNAAFEKIDRAIELTAKNLKFASDLLEHAIWNEFYVLENPVTLKDISRKIVAGGDVPPKNDRSSVETDRFTVPIYTNGEKNKGLYGYTSEARIREPSVTISARGTIGYTVIRNEPFFPAIRLISVTPDTTKISLEYLYYALRNLSFWNTGSSIPQLTVPDMKNYILPLFSKEKQSRIVEKLNTYSVLSERLAGLYTQKLESLIAMKSSMLTQAFSQGEVK